MSRRATSLVVLTGFFAVAAGELIAHGRPAGAPEFSPAASVGAQPVTSQPVYPAGFDAAMLTRLVDKHLADARAAVDRLVGIRERRTAANTLRPFDDAINATQLAEGLAAIAAQLHPDAAIRAEGLRARERISRFRGEFDTDPRVAKAFAALDMAGLTPEERLLVARIRRDYHRDGADRDEATRARLRALFETHDRLTAEFLRNISDSKVLPSSYRKGWPANGAVLDSLLHTREDIARLAGSRDWASYQADTQMAGSADAIRAFLDQIRLASEPARKRSTARYLERARRDDPSITRLRLSQVSPAGDLIRREQYAFDQREVRSYFPFERVKRGVLSIVAEFFDVEFRRVDIPVWHPSVEAYEVRDQGQLIGRVYLDLHQRPERTPNGLGMALPLRGGIKERQLPEVILIAPLPGGQPGDPGLNVANIGVFFHEFGHVMNHLLSVRPYVSTSGFPDEVDFLEVPSLMLEQFAHEPALLRRLSGHVQTGAPIPDDLLKRMHDAEGFSRPMGVGQTTAMAAVSLEMHDRPADAVDPDGLARRAFASDMDVDLDPEMHFPASFAFLALHVERIDYSSNYYTFLWSHVIVEDLWSAFDRANPLDPRMARRYVDTILRPGKSRPPAESVRGFLGRPFNLSSWQRWLEGDERR